ncbi:MAG: DUF3298 domain-containing protein [Minisyncoccia bacterium]
MKKDILLGVIAVLVILGGVIFYAATKPSSTKAPEDIDLYSLSGGSYVEHADYYDIEANYASSTPLSYLVSASADAEAVATMKKFVSDTVAQFKADGNFANLTAEDIQVMGFDKGRKEKLKVMYLVAPAVRTISYVFTIYEDTLGAHGNTFFQTFTFDTKTGAELSLADAFLPNAQYLESLSSISRAKLPGVIGGNADMKFIEPGTTPEEKSFEDFFFNGSDFVLLFAPYAVAPYSEGPQTLRIPLTDLASTLKTEYR